MILNRLLLRLAAVSALSNYQETPYPTIAGEHIFDSRIDPVGTLQGKELYPICVVYTDYDKDALNFKNLSQMGRLLTITFELFCGQIEDRSESGFVLDLPQTDSEIELTLDVFEAQIFDALSSNSIAADTFNTIVYGIEGVISRRGASVEGGQKLAARQITLEAKCLRDAAPGIVPDWVDRFLTELETRGEFPDRVQTIRDILTASSGLSDAARKSKTYGYSSLSASQIGYNTGPAVSLGSNVVWLDNNGQPLS